MLHGWAQNVFVFSNRAKKLTKRLTKAGHRVVFLQAPHRLPPIPTEQKQQQQQQQQQQRCCNGNNTTINNGNENENIDSSGSSSREYAYAWFFYDSNENNNDEPILLPSPTGNHRGMDRSLKLIHEEIQAVRNNNETKNNKNNDDDDHHQKDNDVPLPSPPVYVLVFSQGAVLVHKMATLTCDDDDSDDDCWKYVRKCILVSGFSFTTSIGKTMKTKVTIVNNGSSSNISSSDCNDEGNLDHGGDDEDDDKKATNTTINIIPSLHVLGNNDYRVRPYLTREVYMEEPCFGFGSGILWEHPRGHVIPQDRNFCNSVLEFLADPTTT
jgi:hypothetical protein